MERSRNFYKTIRLGYILISVLIGCIAYNSFYEWQEIEALELDNKKIDEFRKEINNINIQMIKFSLFGETILDGTIKISNITMHSVWQWIVCSAVSKLPIRQSV